MSVTMERRSDHVGRIDGDAVMQRRSALAELVVRIEIAELSEPRYRCELVALFLLVQGLVEKGAVRNFGGYLMKVLDTGDWQHRITDDLFDRADRILTLCEREGLLASYEFDD